MIPIFSTIFGSGYLLKPNGTWRREKFTGENFDGMVYVGSIDISRNPAFYPTGSYVYDELMAQLSRGQVEGFESSFKVGYAPLGIEGYEPDDIFYREGKICGLNGCVKGIHVGHEIVQVHSPHLAEDQSWLHFLQYNRFIEHQSSQ